MFTNADCTLIAMAMGPETIHIERPGIAVSK